MTASSRDDGLRVATSAARRHVLLVVVLVVLGLLLAAAYDRTAGRRYTAVATVLPRPVIGNPLAPGVEVNGTQLIVAMQTEAGLVDTPTVAGIASRILGRRIPTAQDTISATVPANTQIIRIAYLSKTPLAAKQGAQAYAEAFLRYRQDVAAAAQRETLASLESQAETVSAALVKATTAASKSSDPHSLAAQQVQLYSDRLATINSSISSTEAQGTNPGVVVTDAALPSAPNGPSLVILLVAGGLVGLALGVAAAVWRERRADVVDSAVEHTIAGMPVLARLPREAQASEEATAGDQSKGVRSEAYRRVRSGLVALAAPPQVVAVSSLSPGGRSADLVVNVGLCLAEAGFGVTLVSANPGGPGVEKQLSAPQAPGLSDVLTGAATLPDCVHEVQGALVLGAGSDAWSARELFAGPAISQVLQDLRRDNDYVLIATAPTTSADSEAIALGCDGVLLAVTEGSTTHAEAAAVLERFQQMGIRVIGVVSVPPSEPETASQQPIPVDVSTVDEPMRRPLLAPRQPAPDAGTDS